MLVEQIEVGHMDNFCYIVACPESRKRQSLILARTKVAFYNISMTIP
jgi:hypothetical protein